IERYETKEISKEVAKEINRIEESLLKEIHSEVLKDVLSETTEKTIIIEENCIDSRVENNIIEENLVKDAPNAVAEETTIIEENCAEACVENNTENSVEDGVIKQSSAKEPPNETIQKMLKERKPFKRHSKKAKCRARRRKMLAFSRC
ncbi:MAG: hypothetical protein ACTTKH_00700, partial [Treponema sp.]